MNVEIIAVGSELLTPRFEDTNSRYLTRRVNDLGFPVVRRTIVGDRLADLAATVRVALASADLVLIGGGLGPTGDDLTREAVAEALGRPLVFNPEVLAALEERFARRGRVMTAPNRRQAYAVEGAEILENRNGTAPGQWIEEGRARLVLLPGPPHELEALFEEKVRPKLEAWRRGYSARRILRTTGLNESEVETLISGLYPRTAEIGLTILASPGQIDLHVSSFSERSAEEASSRADALAGELRRLLASHVYAEADIALEEVVGRLLREARRTLVSAESCTGGLIAHRLTNVPGSSAYFLEGVVAYSNAAKTRSLGVPPGLIEAHGAVSAPVAEAMALGARERSGADYAVAVTGIAGPSGGSPGKPVGLVFTALSGPEGTRADSSVFFGRREHVKFQASQRALDGLRRSLSGLS